MAATEHELARLESDGVPHGQLIWTEYFFSHSASSHEQRRAFRDALSAAGFTETGTTEESTGDGYWHHWSHTVRRADPDELREADRLAATIAAAHGVRYDEWAVTREMTGEVRLVST